MLMSMISRVGDLQTFHRQLLPNKETHNITNTNTILSLLCIKDNKITVHKKNKLFFLRIKMWIFS